MRDWDKKWEMLTNRERLATIGMGGSLLKVIEIATDALAHPRMRTDALIKIIKEASSNIGDTVKGYQIKDWDAFKAFKGRDIPVTSRVLRDHALAFCFIPMSLFDE